MKESEGRGGAGLSVEGNHHIFMGIRREHPVTRGGVWIPAAEEVDTSSIPVIFTEDAFLCKRFILY